MNDFIVPPIEEDKALPTEQEASEKAFYAAATSEENPIQNYYISKMDLQTTGNSDFVNAAESRWKDEQDKDTRDAVEGVIADPSIDRGIKLGVLQQYSLSGYLPKSLKDRYIQKTAANTDDDVTPTQKEQQDWVVANLENRRAQMDVETRQKDIEDHQSKMQSFLSGVEHLYKGTGNTLGLVSDEDYEAAHKEYNKFKAVNPISTGLGHAVGLIGGALAAAPAGLAGAAVLGGTLSGTSRFAELGQSDVDIDSRVNAALADAGMTTADFALPIFKAASLLKVMILNGGGAVAINELSIGAQNTILEAYPELKQKNLDPANVTVAAVFGGLIGAAFGRKANVDLDANGTLKGTKIPAGSPADVTATANPKIAADMGNAALKDPDGALAAAMGTNKGQIISDWSLPKIVDAAIEKMFPNMSRKLLQIDEEMRELFEDFRYDPNIVNATKRDEDNSTIYEIIRGIKESKYQPANSTFVPSENMVEGKMVFGPNEDGFFMKFDKAWKAAADLADLIKKNIPEAERGELRVTGTGVTRAGKPKGPFKVEWNYKKEYDDQAIQVFGPDSIKTDLLGFDVSGLARSSAGRAFFPTGRLPKEVEKGAIRNVERGARLERGFVKLFDELVSKTPYKRELDTLINDAEELGVDAFSKAEISAKFPKLKEYEVDSLFQTHTYWRRMNHYFHAFANREARNELLNKKMVGAYDGEGNYIGAVSKDVPQNELNEIKEIWDYEKNGPVPYKAEDVEAKGQTVVKVDDIIQDGIDRYPYALIGGSHKLDMLPAEVLPRIPGYSPRVVKERFFVDAIPTSLRISGKTITDPKILREHAQTIAASRTFRDGETIIQGMKDSYPNHNLQTRAERRDTHGVITAEMKVHTEMFKQAKRRGERLPSLNGPARIEDRLASAVKMAKSLSRMGAWGQWEQNFIDSFKKGFAQFLPKGEFPQSAIDIVPLKNMTPQEIKAYKTALRSWEYYANQKNYETLGDHLWKRNLHNIADILEKWRIPAGYLRDIADKGNLGVTLPKKFSTIMYIHMAPLRQWLVQPAQLAEMHLINPDTFAQSMGDLLLTRLYLSSVLHGKAQKVYEDVVLRQVKASGRDVDEFKTTIEAIKKSGMIEGIDMNVLVHGFFKEVDRNLIENSFEKITRDAAALATSPMKLARAYGFDAAELTNRVGLFLQTKQMWMKKNPGKKWDTKENLEDIAYEATRLSGTMSRPGNLPYQEGALSVVFQFAAISHKLTMNLLQGNATMLSGKQRAALAATRLALYGAEAGAIGGAMIYTLVDKNTDPILEANPSLADGLRRGLMDYASNHLIAAIVDPDTPSDLAITRGMSPYSEHFLPYFDVMMEMMKLVDDRPSTNPRFAAVGMAGTFSKTVRDMKGWFTGREITSENFKQAALEAAELASGMSHISQGYLMLGIQEKVTANGNTIGMQYSKAEAYGKMLFGINSLKEQQLYDALTIFGNHTRNKEQVAKDIHQVLVNIEGKIGQRTEEESLKQLKSYISLLPKSQFSEQDRIDIVANVMQMQKKQYTSLNESFMTKLLARNQQDQVDSDKQVLNEIGRSADPKTQQLLKLWTEGKL